MLTYFNVKEPTNDTEKAYVLSIAVLIILVISLISQYTFLENFISSKNLMSLVAFIVLVPLTLRRYPIPGMM